LRKVCGSSDGSNCNGWLDQEFEQPAQPHVRSVFRGDTLLDRDGVRSFALWWLKTLLLLSHPDVERTFWREGPRSWAAFPADLLRYLRRTGAFPPDLSLWMAVPDPM